jgi:hypothetical protein
VASLRGAMRRSNPGGLGANRKPPPACFASLAMTVQYERNPARALRRRQRCSRDMVRGRVRQPIRQLAPGGRQERQSDNAVNPPQRMGVRALCASGPRSAGSPARTCARFLFSFFAAARWRRLWPAPIDSASYVSCWRPTDQRELSRTPRLAFAAVQRARGSGHWPRNPAAVLSLELNENFTDRIEQSRR